VSSAAEDIDTLAVARAQAAELRRRDELRQEMLAGCLPQQRNAINDDAMLKALFCARRSGKSWTIGVYLFLTASEHPGCSCLYLGLTRETTRGIMNKDIFRLINERYQLGAVWKASEMTWTLPNGSIIYLRGADVNQYEIAKVVGQKYRLAVLDEASKFRHDLRIMVYEALLPAMGDDLGTIALSGTPSNNVASLFFDVTTGIEPGWAMHRWHWRDNVYKRDNIQKMHDKLVSTNPAIVETPGYKQEWRGEWYVDTEALVYRPREDLNVIEALPRPPHEYTYLLGLDMGFKDATAFVVGAYSEHDPTLYIVWAHKESGLIISSVADRVHKLWNRTQPMAWRAGSYPFAKMVVDAAGLQGVEEMRQRCHLPLDAAEKRDKKLAIDMLNSELMTGRIKLLPGAMSLADEWRTLIWSEKERKSMPAKWVEDPRLDNHLCDAMTYMWRAARNYDARPAPEPKLDDLRFDAQYGDRHLQEMLATRATKRPGDMMPGRIQIGMPQMPRFGR
jgi:hypothetical protein